MTLQNFRFSLNGNSVSVEAWPMERLLDVLRHQLHIPSPKEGCGEGECGACSVFMNGELVNSCLIPIAQAQGKVITTLEHLNDNATDVSTGEALHPIQAAFLKKGGAQCGICTPGMILAAKALLDSNPHPTREEIAVGLAGNLCRCTGYTKIIDAVEEASRS